MAIYSFTEDELKALKGIAERIKDSATTIDDDTSAAIERVLSAGRDIELTDLQRIGLQSMMQVTLAMEETTGEQDYDKDVLQSAMDKLSS